jgi:predicted O-methyltransferase YrrM
MRRYPKTLGSELTDEEMASLTGLLRMHHFTGNLLEIGTAAGGTLIEMMKCYEERERPHFVVVDNMAYFEDQFEIIRRNLKEHGLNPDAIEFRVARSYDAFKQAEQAREVFDFIFIDGAHECRYVMQDLSWARLLRKDGILCLHDYSPKTRGVVAAADRFLKKNVNYSIITLVGSLLAVRKCDVSRVPEISVGDRVFATLLAPLQRLHKSIEKRIGSSRKAAGGDGRSRQIPH